MKRGSLGSLAWAVFVVAGLGCGATTRNDAESGGSGGSDLHASGGGQASGGSQNNGGGGTSGAGASGGTGGGGSGGTTAGTGGDATVACNEPERASAEQWVIRLERLLWGTDGSLLSEALASGELELESAADVQALAQSMLSDPDRGRSGLPSFVKTWLALDETRLEMSDDMLASTLDSTDRTLEAMLFELDSPLADFYSGHTAIVDERLADYYGVEPPAGDWGKVTLPEERQAGLFGQALWLNAQHHPARRGMVLMGSLSCVVVPPLPSDFEFSRETMRTDMTRREEYLANVENAACWTCHALIAPLGLPFEHFDGWGDYRTEDNGFPIDASGGIPSTDIEVTGPRELTAAFADRLGIETEHCAARRAVAYSLGQTSTLPLSVFDDLSCFERLNRALADLDDASFVEWAVALVGSPIFLAEYPE